ncbi:uncharacterized protein LOC122856214, partial [Aphidius gifuensis]|uniref:uncharacterized protein LOC122856214 n=1 Tax=Aphidius gifuensis TaxID=684658 RepID=UPI001CDD878F
MESQFKVDLTLQQISLTRVAINLWEQPLIKKKIRQSIITMEKTTTTATKNDNEKIKLIKLLLQQIQDMDILDSMKHLLSCMIKPIGDRLMDWLTRIHKKLKGYTIYPTIYNYLDNIHWTTIGTIDEVKVFKKIYNNIDNVNSINMIFLFEESCYYCLKKYITTMWNDFSYVERDILWSKVESNGPTPDVYNLIYWILYLSDKQLLDFIKEFSPNDYLPYKGLTDKRNMFNFSSTIGNDVSVKYFFNRLTDDEKNNYLIHAAEQLLFNEKERQYNHSLVPIDKQINNLKFIGDTLIFFIKEMSVDTRNKFFNKSCNFILGALARELPWRFFYLTVLNYCWSYFDDFNYQILFNNIINIIIEENKYNGTMKYSSLWLISETWKNSPLKLKKSINKYEIIDSFLNNILTSDYE